jgi:hypothetical protein
MYQKSALVPKAARRGRELTPARPGNSAGKRLKYSHVLCYPYPLLEGRSITLVLLPGNLLAYRCTKVQSFPPVHSETNPVLVD